jgi:hypothetical protein
VNPDPEVSETFWRIPVCLRIWNYYEHFRKERENIGQGVGITFINSKEYLLLNLNEKLFTHSVADPDDFCPDPDSDPTFQIVKVRIRIVAHIKFVQTFSNKKL